MKTACVTLEDVIALAQVRAASLAPETSGYLSLAVADTTSRMMHGIEDRAVLLTTEGKVSLARKGPFVPPDAAAKELRDLLTRLLAVSSGTMPGLASAARARDEEKRGVEGVVEEIEAALIPVNRSAARRALARLAREATKAKDQGKLRARASRQAEESPAPGSGRQPSPTLIGLPPQPSSIPVAAPPPPPKQAEEPLMLTPTPAPVLPLVASLPSEPFALTPQTEPVAAAFVPSRRPTVLHTAPWKAIDDNILALLDRTELGAPTGVVEGPEPESTESPVLDLFVEDLPEIGAPETAPEGVSLASEADVATDALTIPIAIAVATEAVLASQPAPEVEVARTTEEDAAREAETKLEAGTKVVAEPIGEAGLAGASPEPEPVPVLCEPTPGPNGTPHIFHILRGKKRAEPAPHAPRTRADDLLEDFTTQSELSQSLRATAASLKSWVGLEPSPTPPPIPERLLLPLPEDEPAPRSAPRRETWQGPMLPRRKASLAGPALFFALGILSAVFVVWRFRPDVVADLRGKTVEQRAEPPKTAPTSAPAAVPVRAPERGRDHALPGARADRDATQGPRAR